MYSPHTPAYATRSKASRRNSRNRKDSSVLAAVQQAGAERLRPIVLTSLTTFAGLAPIMFEGSHVAEFILPLAVSLAFGVVFATFITLILVPTSYLIMEDAGWLLRRIARKVL